MHLIAHLIHEYGLIAVATIVALECLGFPVPGETALLGAAIYAGTKHDLNIGAVIIVAAGAAIIGRMIGYVMGRELGYRLVLQYGKYVGLTEGRIKLAQYLFFATWRQNHFHGPIRASAAILCWASCRCQRYAMAQFLVCQCYQFECLGDELRLRRVLGRSGVRTFSRPPGDLSSNYYRDRNHRHRNLCPSARSTIDRRGRACDARASQIALITCFITARGEIFLYGWVPIRRAVKF